uniref:Rab-GAP TBC domain-containing protein n=2 Tax=Aplanochytrium stocchinoi TaxID=215587 RepID=A0A7S3PLN3_9STRA|mmetsp:Transcript_2508/g.3387  ORF Transcript_2508/g.3387 Transcript_2508/m.3387 type:complete len:562 (+) Transcript_2508:171-1856(+)
MLRLTVEKHKEIGLRLKQDKTIHGIKGSNECVKVTGVQKGAISDLAGIRTGDTLVLIDNVEVSTMEYSEVLQTLREKRPLILAFSTSNSNSNALQQKKPSQSESKSVKLFLTDAFESGFEIINQANVNAVSNGTSISNPNSETAIVGTGTNTAKPNTPKVSREILFEQALQSGDMDSLRMLAFTGVPEKVRGVTWKVLLGYFELSNPNSWPTIQVNNLELYRSFKKEVMREWESADEAARRPSRLEGQGWWEFNEDKHKKKKPQHIAINESLHEKQKKKADECVQKCDTDTSTPSDLVWQVADDDPLSSVNAKLVETTEDRDLREEIWKDAQRTHPGLHFFTEKTCQVLERILFIYAKLNPGVRYVQGMNEILAPISFVLDCRKDEQSEADTFFCFCNLMAEIRDMYIKGLDSSNDGLRGRIDALMLLVKKHDPVLFQHLEMLNINPQFYALRWLTTLLSREFELPDTVRIWDSLLADPSRFDFLLYVACAMLRAQREFLLANDFAECLKMLQTYPTSDVAMLLSYAFQMHDLDQKQKKNKIPLFASKLKLEVSTFLSRMM